MCDHPGIQSDRQIGVVCSFFFSDSHDRTGFTCVGNLQENENPMDDSEATFENGNRSEIRKKEYRNSPKGI
ncbi:hypothetical protein EHQ05_04185 [Leptospira yasudae]|nr:hypothetical protein EHQ05_04185 [Leptospira yasudae]TGM04454.1 hypothetical protein EHQ86_14550 [Leptospira yasudae]